MKSNKKVLVLPCKDQERIIRYNLERIDKMSNKPDHVVVIDDHSSMPTLESTPCGWLHVYQADERGRASTRNKGLVEALKLGADVIIFMDGDSIAEDELYFERLDDYFKDPEKSTLVFGTRVHEYEPRDLNKWYEGDDTVYKTYPRKPSDLLTANMDNLQNGEPLDNRDLREVSGVVEALENAKSFNEKVDLILTGMVSWSCNFALNKKAALDVRKFMFNTYGAKDMIFDETAFRTQWGYEDVAFGLDSIFAGVDVQLQDQSRVVHFMHGRSDELYTHIQGRHLIMDRYRHILKVNENSNYLVVDGDIKINENEIFIKGRGFDRSDELSEDVTLTIDGDIIIGNYIYDFKENTFTNRKKNGIIRTIINFLTHGKQETHV